LVTNNLFKHEIIVRITDSVFANNYAGPLRSSSDFIFGGAIAYAVYEGPKITSTITGCTFRNNTAGFAGGAIAVLNGNAKGSDGTIDMNITGCTFRDNAAGYAAAIYFAIYFSAGVNASMDIANSSFTNNTGSAVFVGGAPNFPVVFMKSNFSNNIGGAVQLATTLGSVPASFSECIFEANGPKPPPSHDGDCGGAIFYNGPPATIPMTDCTFIKPTNTSAGHNDIALPSNSSVTFYCPEGFIGKPAVITPSAQGRCWPNSTIPVVDLPPSNEVVHCAAAKYICDALTGTCKQDQSGSFPSKQACKGGCTATPTPAPCQVPRNCGQYNNSIVCGHTFTGCEFVCGKGSDPATVGCCHANIHRDDTCNQCVDYLCKPPPPLPPPVTTKYACITKPNFHCIEYAIGTYSSATECEKDCPPSLNSLLLEPAIEEELEEDTMLVR
jgi:hypothetical protein